MAFTDLSGSSWVVSGFVLPARASRIQLLLLRSVGAIAHLSLRLSPVQLIIRGPESLGPRNIVSSLVALSRKGSAVRWPQHMLLHPLSA